jgi:hypothetical protein
MFNLFRTKMLFGMYRASETVREISGISLPLAVASDLGLSSHDDIVVWFDFGKRCQASLRVKELEAWRQAVPKVDANNYISIILSIRFVRSAGSLFQCMLSALIFIILRHSTHASTFLSWLISSHLIMRACFATVLTLINQRELRPVSQSSPRTGRNWLAIAHLADRVAVSHGGRLRLTI